MPKYGSRNPHMLRILDSQRRRLAVAEQVEIDRAPELPFGHLTNLVVDGAMGHGACHGRDPKMVALRGAEQDGAVVLKIAVDVPGQGRGQGHFDGSVILGL